MAGAEPMAAKPAGGLVTRIVAGALLAAIAGAAAWAGGHAFAALVMLVIVIGRWEWGDLVAEWRLHRLLQMLMLPAVVFVTLVRDALHGLVALAVLLFGTAVWRLADVPQVRAGWRASLAGSLYVGLPAVALVALRDRPDGLPLLAFVLGTVWATDIFAFFAGRAIGGPKLAPAISPGKTWAGLAGGVAAAALFGALLARLADWNPAMTALAAAVLAVVAQGGDLFESWMKRRASVKDSGTLIPGHGGILDRVDGLIPVSVVVGAAVLGAGLGPGGGPR